jgi:hypothetical protein
MSYVGTFSAVLLALVAFKFFEPWIAKLIEEVGRTEYVVTTTRAITGSPSEVTEYLTAIRHDPYRKGLENTHMSTTEFEDAFVFKELAAAEFAAVYVGGIVKERGIH